MTMWYPNRLPRWADANGGDNSLLVVEPTEEQKDAGFLKRQKPPAPFLNWLHYYAYVHAAFNDQYRNDRSEFYERWDIANGSLTATTNQIADLAKRWDYVVPTADATVKVTWEDPGFFSLYSARSALLDQGTAHAAHLQVLQTHNPIACVFNKTLFMWEADVIPQAIGGQEWHVGIGSTASGSTGDITIGFYSDYTLANWQFYNNNVAGKTDTGIPIVTGFIYRLRFILDKTLATPVVSYFIRKVDTTGGVINKIDEVAFTPVGGSIIPADTTLIYPTFTGRNPANSGCQLQLGEVRATYTRT